MNRPAFSRWVPWILAVFVCVGIGIAAYNAGLSRGLATSLPAGSTIAVWPPYLGFHPFGFVFPLFFLLFWFAVARFVFWGRPWRHRWHDDRPDGGVEVPRRFEEWHKQLHERMKT